MPFWSKTDGWVIAVLCIITTWKTFGYNFINILAGVSGVSQEVIEAARLDQVPMWKIFLDIIVPMSSATGIYVFITTIVQDRHLIGHFHSDHAAVHCPFTSGI